MVRDRQRQHSGVTPTNQPLTGKTYPNNMSPEQQQIQELKQQVQTLTDFMMSFESAVTVPPITQETIKRVASATLNSLSDVDAPNPSNGQVLKYNGTQWTAQTDNN